MRRFLTLALAFFLYNCGSDAPELKEYDLLEYGVPMSIQVPVDSPSVTTGDGFLGEKEVKVKAGNNYDILISYAPATTSDLAELKAEQVANVKSISTFSKMVKEDDAGFIYESAIDSTALFYGFRYIRLQGDQRYLFQSGLIGTFSLEDTEVMYESVKGK
ncbi:MAG: hypothetical protein AAF806_25540 [Bacteroidota bacterium]